MTDLDLENLDNAWDTDNGFLGKLREGTFDRSSYENFMQLLRSISFPEDGLVPTRGVTLLWYIYPFIEWQKERVVKDQILTSEQYDMMSVNIMNELERILGIP